jgi:hypothetical protein
VRREPPAAAKSQVTQPAAPAGARQDSRGAAETPRPFRGAARFGPPNRRPSLSRVRPGLAPRPRPSPRPGLRRPPR